MVHHVTGKRRPDIAVDHVAYYSRCWATSFRGLGPHGRVTRLRATTPSWAPFTQHSCTRRTKRVDRHLNDSGSPPVPDLQAPPAFSRTACTTCTPAKVARALRLPPHRPLTLGSPRSRTRNPVGRHLSARAHSTPAPWVYRTRFPRLREASSPRERTRRSSGEARQKDAVTTETKKPRGRSGASLYIYPAPSQCPPLPPRHIPNPNPSRPSAAPLPVTRAIGRRRADVLCAASVILSRKEALERGGAPCPIQSPGRSGDARIGEGRRTAGARCRGTSRPRRRRRRRPWPRRRRTTTITAPPPPAASSATPSPAPPLVSVVAFALELPYAFRPVVSFNVSGFGGDSGFGRRCGGGDLRVPARCHQDQVPGPRLAQACHRHNWR